MVITLLPFCSTFHTHLKIVGCFFFSFCLFSWNGIWKVIKSEQVLKASYQFVDTTGHSCSATSLAIIDLEHSFVFVFTWFYFFLPKHCSIQNCSAKERILGYWVAPYVTSERERFAFNFPLVCCGTRQWAQWVLFTLPPAVCSGWRTQLRGKELPCPWPN